MKEGWLAATLAEKIPERILKQDPGLIRRVLAKDVEGLKVDGSFSARHGWLEVQAKGEDAEAFVNLLKEKFDEAPVQSSRVERWDVFKGFVTGSGTVGFGVYVDLGIFDPVRKDALYPLHRMRAQLEDGVGKPCREILGEHSLVDFFPLRVVVSEIDGGKLGVELADGARDTLLSWKRLPFDRVIAVGAEKQQVENAVKSEDLQYDVIRIESLSLLVQCLVCKVDTDAPGIIAKIGGRLRGAGLSSYRTPTRWARL